DQNDALELHETRSGDVYAGKHYESRMRHHTVASVRNRAVRSRTLDDLRTTGAGRDHAGSGHLRGPGSRGTTTRTAVEGARLAGGEKRKRDGRRSKTIDDDGAAP